MKKRIILLVAACLALIVLAGAQRASAQCCSFDVTATTALGGRWPFTFLTDWSGTQQTYVKNSGQPGHVTVTLNNCPPTRTFSWVSIDGGVTQIPLNTPTNMNLLCGVCVTITAVLDNNGCVSIVVQLCT